MDYIEGEQSDRFDSNECPPDSREVLAEKLQASEAKVQALEAKIQALETQVRNSKAELHVLQNRVSRQHPGPHSVSVQLPPEPLTTEFCVENPQDLLIKCNVNEKQSRDLQKLLSQVPKTEEEWCQQRRNVQLSNPGEVTMTFLNFITRTQSQTTASKIRIDPQSFTGEGLLRSYRRFVDGLQQDSTHAHQIANFAALLLVCLCRVARQGGVHVDLVDELMDNLLPRKYTTKSRASAHLKNLRTAVLWPILQAELLRKKFAHRADEFFLLCRGQRLEENAYRLDADVEQMVLQSIHISDSRKAMTHKALQI